LRNNGITKGDPNKIILVSVPFEFQQFFIVQSNVVCLRRLCRKLTNLHPKIVLKKEKGFQNWYEHTENVTSGC